ncbi:MAG: sigma-54 dependent transcriptional regulator [Clostridia bacterium]|nr:sigma-54 dependent transcriptional regulator [Clostridia bacterium]
MNILLVDNDADCLKTIGDFIEELGHSVSRCCDGEEAFVSYCRGNYPLVIAAIDVPKMSGMELLCAINDDKGIDKTKVVLLMKNIDSKLIINALRQGVYDYFLKPVKMEKLVDVIQRVIDEHDNYQNDSTIEFSKEVSRKGHVSSEIIEIGQLKMGFFVSSMIKIAIEAQKYYSIPTMPVLIEGETGTGKEILAKIIHYGDSINDSPFVDINCAALNRELFESELFGYVQGAFTGGKRDGQKGKFDLAGGGTIFLDEIAEIPLELQGKLLRVLQEREYYRVGGLQKIKFNARIICATNASLGKKVDDGKFRKDLFYRLKVGRLYIPPLRCRKKEIIPLSKMFLEEFNLLKDKNFLGISREAKRFMVEYHWPGNVRELKNVLDWVTSMFCDSEVKFYHLKELFNNEEGEKLNEEKQLSFDFSKQGLPEEGFSLENYINNVIKVAFKKNNRNVAKTARYLGITRHVLYNRLSKINSE